MAKSTLAQEVSTGTAESFTDHELSDPAPHLALLRNRPTVGAVNSADDKATTVEPEFPGSVVIVISEWQQMAYHEIQEMTKRGVVGGPSFKTQRPRLVSRSNSPARQRPWIVHSLSTNLPI